MSDSSESTSFESWDFTTNTVSSDSVIETNSDSPESVCSVCTVETDVSSITIDSLVNISPKFLDIVAPDYNVSPRPNNIKHMPGIELTTNVDVLAETNPRLKVLTWKDVALRALALERELRRQKWAETVQDVTDIELFSKNYDIDHFALHLEMEKDRESLGYGDKRRFSLRPKLQIDELTKAPEHLLRVNISGKIFDVPKKLIDNYPAGLLASPDIEKYYEPSLGMYFFDRNRMAFEAILQFYRVEPGKLILFPDYIPDEIMKMELDYFRIGWRYFIGRMDEVSSKTEYRDFREKTFAFFNDPDYSMLAKVYMFVDLGFICVSILHFVLETEPMIIQAMEKYSLLTLFFRMLTWVCTFFFTFDLTVRLVFCLNILDFFGEITTWLDLIAVFPFYVDIIMIYYPTLHSTKYKFLDVLRIARISRCFKIFRRSERLLLIINILQSCVTELGVMCFAWLLGVLLSGSIIYFAENPIMNLITNTTNASYHMTKITYDNGTSIEKSTIWFFSIMESCWWAVVTISTTGYGNIYPFYAPGKLITTCIIFCSSVFMAIPMTIIIKRFSESYEKKAEEERPRKIFGGRVLPGNIVETYVEIRKCSRRGEQTKDAIAKFRKNKGRYCMALWEQLSGCFLKNKHC